jgi:hypothetical protein
LDALWGYILIGEKILNGKKIATTYNFGPSQSSKLTVQSIAEMLIDRSGSRISIKIEPGNYPEAQTLLLDSTRAMVDLHWDTKLSSEAAIAWTCQFEFPKETQLNSGMNLIMALSYSSRWEILKAVKQIALDVKSGHLDPETITQPVFQQYLSTNEFPDPELMIRTSGEYRISNFLLFQLAYAELHFTNTLWPDFRKENLYEAIIDFQNRERRFGKTAAQIENLS